MAIQEWDASQSYTQLLEMSIWLASFRAESIRAYFCGPCSLLTHPKLSMHNRWMAISNALSS
jgi:hypothetical protein